MTRRLDLLVVSALMLLGACYSKEEDTGDVCVYTSEEDGQNLLRVHAQGPGCTGDHRGAYLKCTITVDGLNAHIETVFKDGRDPNDACAGPVEATCEVVVEPGTYTLDFDGDELAIAVPEDEGEHVCFGPDFGTGTD
jgi:hypothetical protein